MLRMTKEYYQNNAGLGTSCFKLMCTSHHNNAGELKYMERFKCCAPATETGYKLSEHIYVRISSKSGYRSPVIEIWLYYINKVI